MKKQGWLAILTVLILTLGCIGTGFAEIIPPCGPGQQIGYPAVVLCEKLTLREKPNTSSKTVKTLYFRDQPIITGADQPEGAKEEDAAAAADRLEQERERARLFAALEAHYGLDFEGHLAELYHTEALHKTAEYMRKHY